MGAVCFAVVGVCGGLWVCLGFSCFGVLWEGCRAFEWCFTVVMVSSMVVFFE